MNERLGAFRTQQRLLDFAAVKRACPKGVYLALTAKEPNIWQGVLFVRKGPYAPAILRFTIYLSVLDRPPVIAFSTDIFHPLVTPLTTYTYTNSDTGTDTVSASDEERLPPGGFSLRHGFPQWFHARKLSAAPGGEQQDDAQHDRMHSSSQQTADDGQIRSIALQVSDPPPVVHCQAVDIVRVLFYMRSAFDSETLLDKVPLEAAGNPGAWHAWQAHRAKSPKGASPARRSGHFDALSSVQPGGARRPGQWNWEGVWEERVRKGIHASVSQNALYGNSQDAALINFVDADPEFLEQVATWKHDMNPESEAASV